MNDHKERTTWIKAQEAAADEDPHGYPEPGEPNESTEERMQRFFFQQVTEGNATADGDGVQTLTVTIALAEYRRLAQQDGKLEYLQEQLDKKEEALTFMHQKSIEDDKAASNYRRQIEDLKRDRRNPGRERQHRGQRRTENQGIPGKGKRSHRRTHAGHYPGRKEQRRSLGTVQRGLQAAGRRRSKAHK